MRLFEIEQPLLESEVTSLYEAHHDELHAIIDANITTPLGATIDKLVMTTAPKLKAWAMASYHDLNKHAVSGVSAELLQKIINDPQKISRQLIVNASKKCCGMNDS